MSRITKSISKDVAIQMTSELRKKIEQVKIKRSQLVQKSILEKIPDEILLSFKYFPDYMNVNSYYYVSGEGFTQQRVVTENIPNAGNSRVILNPEQSKEFFKLTQELEDLEQTQDFLITSIMNTLNSLKTHNRVKEEFIEAFKFLPNKDSKDTSLLVPLDNLRNKLKQHCKIEE